MTDDTGRSRGWMWMAGGIVVGALVLTGLRFALQESPHSVHFHANWALMVDGQRVDLTAQRYMVDVLQCTIDPSHQSPADRVHMHEGNHDVVHVHSSGVTWGHLLANLGFGAGDDYLELRDRMLQADSARTLKFVLNGNRVRSIRNLAIGDQDRLLISFGDESIEEVVANQFPEVAQSAGEYNTRPDPASCSGAHEETFGERLRRAAIGR